ncbi:MAG: HDOD domain-containing protein [Planctomycetota bacterium]
MTVRPSPSVRAEELVDELTDIRTLPDVAIKVSQLASQENAEVRRIEELIRVDPVLVGRVLRMVNSAYFGLRSSVDSISKAIIFIGLKNLRNLVIVDSLRDFFIDDGNGDGFSRRRLWSHGVAVGMSAQLIASRLYGSPGEDAFLAGMLHDIGLMVEDQLVSDDLNEAIRRYAQDESSSLVTLEDELVGTNHTLVGECVAERWGFPEEVRDAISQHHDLFRNSEDLVELAVQTQIAEYVADVTGNSLVKNRIDSPAGIVETHITERIDDYQILVDDLHLEIQRATSIYDT